MPVLPWHRVQRVLDLSIITITAVVWIPCLLLLLVIKLIMDGQPVVFHQVRVGHNGRHFVIHKIRITPASYQPKREDWPTDDSPPQTPFGRWLCHHDLDELPQLEMSLVGPRPETPYHSARFAASLPEYTKRLIVRPGLTGLAQVRGWRGNTSIEQRLTSDLEYLFKRSFGPYCIISLRTLGLEVRRWFMR